MAVQTQIQTRRGTAASWTSTNPTLAAGEIGFESDTGKIKIGTGSTAWNALAYTASSTAVTYLYNATAAQTTFSGADANGLTLAYTVGSEQVYLNGVLQVRGSDYTATNGTSIVLTSGALVSDVLNVIAFSALALADTYTQAQADAKFVQQSNNFFAGKNKALNGAFDIWQRGTSINLGYGQIRSSDRWHTNSDSSLSGTSSRQAFTAGSAPVAGYEFAYFMRQNITGVSGGSFIVIAGQDIEDVRTFAGQTITASFWAKADSTRTYNVSYQQQFGTGGSSPVYGGSTSISVGTSWTRYTVNIAIPSISGKTVGTGSYLLFYILASSVATQTFDIAGVQLEAGSIVTPFQTATGTLAGELAACQRYYYRTSATGAVSYAAFSPAYAKTSTQANSLVKLPVTMRVVPTAIDAANLGFQAYGGTIYAVTSPVFNTGCTTQDLVLLEGTISGATAGHTGQLISNASASGYLGFSAEL